LQRGHLDFIAHVQIHNNYVRSESGRQEHGLSKGSRLSDKLDFIVALEDAANRFAHRFTVIG
jgi:hypothetical protein